MSGDDVFIGDPIDTDWGAAPAATAPRPAAAPRPAPATDEVPADATDRLPHAEYQELEERVVRTIMPILPAIVVYLGKEPHKSVPMKGRIFVERTEVAPGEFLERREAVNDQISSYDFSSRDSFGRLIRSRLIPDTFAKPHLRGKVFSPVEHPEHLRLFRKMRGADGTNDFTVLAKPEHLRVLEEYILRRERTMQTHKRELEETVTTQ